jgi:hypothetical protein
MATALARLLEDIGNESPWDVSWGRRSQFLMTPFDRGHFSIYMRWAMFLIE